MPRAAKHSLAILVEGSGITGHVRAIDSDGARLRVRLLADEAGHTSASDGARTPVEPTVRPDGEKTDLLQLDTELDFVFSIPSLSASLSLVGRVTEVGEPDGPRDAISVRVAFAELPERAQQFVATCHKLTETALEQAEAIVAGLYDPAVMVDLTWRALYFNSPYIKLSGMRTRALQRKFDDGTLPFEIVGDDPAIDAQMAGDAARLARAVHLAQTIVTNTAGDEYLGTLSYIPVLGPFGDVIALIQTFRDESAENRMQEHYRELLAYERKRVERMAKLVTGLAHQINTPLGIINTAGSLIENALDVPVAYMSPTRQPTADELEGFFSELRASSLLLKRNVARVNQLVTKVKDLSTTQLTASRELADLADLVRESLTTMARLLKDRNIRINCQWDHEYEFLWDGYPDHLTRVIRELIQNTISYGYPTADGGDLDIRIIHLDRQNMFQMELEDYGMGIPEELLRQIFEPFVTSDPARATGLGLAIAENIVTNLLHGRLECTSNLGNNSKFTIFLPAQVP